ncbi:MAG: hypothetical protein K2F81_05275, partial [Ruminococcus sp.]|nr:hypothetical protein [Ruminococcus sp.]
ATTQKPQTTTPSTTTPTQTQPYWCNEGGKHHVINVGIGWFTSYNEATNAAKNFLIKNENYYHYQVDQCFCGKYTATVW